MCMVLYLSSSEGILALHSPASLKKIPSHNIKNILYHIRCLAYCIEGVESYIYNTFTSLKSVEVLHHE